MEALCNPPMQRASVTSLFNGGYLGAHTSSTTQQTTVSTPAAPAASTTTTTPTTTTIEKK